MSNLRNSAAAAAVLVAAGIAVVPAFAETLGGAMAKAYTHNSDLNSARAGVRVTDETVVTLPGYPRLDCKFAGLHDGSKDEEGRLSLRPTFLTQRDSGLVRFGERLWNVQSVNNLATQRSSFPLGRFGYEVRRSGAVVAAVEVAGRGRVWFVPGLADDERRELAVTVAALLYYGVLLEQMDL